jgi:hypothetical protein
MYLLAQFARLPCNAYRAYASSRPVLSRDGCQMGSWEKVPIGPPVRRLRIYRMEGSGI